MSLLRLRASLAALPVRCEWALVNDSRDTVAGEGPLAELPRRAERVQLVVPAAEALITRARLPQAARRQAGSVLAYAIEDETVSEPDAGQVSWLGSAGEMDVLAVIDKEGLLRWLDALAAIGLRPPEIHSEILLLPFAAGEWNLAWDGREGIVRTGKLEGAATDCGDSLAPPLSLRLMIDEARARGEAPAAIAIHVAAMELAPDLAAWQRELEVPLHLAEPWDWRTAPPQAGISLSQQARRWRLAPGLLARLRPAACILGIAVAVHAVALIADWTQLAREQQSLRAGMVAQFRTTFPDAVAVVDPVLQMRRKLAEARHAAGQPDAGDFLPMIEQMVASAGTLPAGTVRAMSYEGGRMTLELSGIDEAGVRRIVAQLIESGLAVEVSAAATRGAAVVLTVRAT